MVHATPGTDGLKLMEGTWRWCVEMTKHVMMRFLRNLRMDVAILSADSRNALMDLFPRAHTLRHRGGNSRWFMLSDPLSGIRAFTAVHPIKVQKSAIPDLLQYMKRLMLRYNDPSIPNRKLGKNFLETNRIVSLEKLKQSVQQISGITWVHGCLTDWLRILEGNMLARRMFNRREIWDWPHKKDGSVKFSSVSAAQWSRLESALVDQPLHQWWPNFHVSLRNYHNRILPEQQCQNSTPLRYVRRIIASSVIQSTADGFSHSGVFLDYSLELPKMRKKRRLEANG